jgi:hypothetical protein
LNLNPGESVVTPGAPLSPPLDAANNNNKKKKVKKAQPPPKKPAAEANHDQPDICKLEFNVGEITKLWVHPTADNSTAKRLTWEKPNRVKLLLGAASLLYSGRNDGTALTSSQ